MFDNDFAVYIIGVVVMMVVLMGYFVYDSHSQQEQMKSCVAAGKDWIRVKGDYYECKEVK